MHLLQIKIQSLNKFINLPIKLLNIAQGFKSIQQIKIFNIKLKQKKFTILKSPHVNKTSREQFLFQPYVKKINILSSDIKQSLNFLLFFKQVFSKNTIIQIKISKFR